MESTSARLPGSTGITPDLLSDLRAKTTYPPTALGFASLFYTNVVFSPRVARDPANPPDQGFHYDPIDYVVCGLYASNSLVTVSPGTVIAGYGSNLFTYGLGIGPGARLICSGSPTSSVRLVAYNTVQEQSVSAWTKPSYALVTDAFGFGARPSEFSFTEFASLGRDIPYVSGGLNPIGFSHCKFYSGNLYLYLAQSTMTNCLLEQVDAMIDSLDSSGPPPIIQNNLFWGGTFNFCPGRNDAVLADNLFDGTAIPDLIAANGNTYLGGFNAFVTNQARLLPAQSTDIILPSSPQYQAGPLGSYYLPATSTLINAGTNKTADQVGLYHFTVCTNLLNGKQIPETNSWVDIGLHYLALDSSGNPLDADAGGVPDFIEDWSGNGNCETNRESDWRPGHSDDDYAYLLSPQYLRVEYRENPWGVDAKDPWTGKQKPRFFWTVASQRRGARQLAYSVKVASSPENLASGVYDVWNGPQVFSDDTIHVEYDGATLQSGQRLWWKVKTWDLHTGLGKWSTNAFFQMGLLDPTNDWAGAKWIGVYGYQSSSPLPMFRSGPFVLTNQIKSATAYVTAKGVYELWVNAQKIGPNILAPEWTDYHVRIQYQTFDLTAALCSGYSTATNVIGAFVGKGWCYGNVGSGSYNDPKNPQLLVLLVVTNSDFSTYRFYTDSTWMCSTNGLIQEASIYDGEKQNGNLEGYNPDWTSPSWRPYSFTNAVTTEPPNASKLFSQPNEPIRIAEHVRPIAMWTNSRAGKSVTVFDMGQNIVGWCRLSILNTNGIYGAGSNVVLKHAEVLVLDGQNNYPNGPNPTNIYPLNCSPQTDIFNLNGDTNQIFEPHFTYHGFRFVEVSAPPAVSAALNTNSLLGCVIHSGVPITGSAVPGQTNFGFRTSSSPVNRLMENAFWSLRGNLQGVFTACTQRGEREGYLFDEHIFSQTACYFVDMGSFLTKWIRDIRDAQEFVGVNGAFTQYAPWDDLPLVSRTDTDPGSLSGGLILPWRLYENYGDVRMLAEHYASAARWLQNLTNRFPSFLYTFPGDKVQDWMNADWYPTARGLVNDHPYAWLPPSPEWIAITQCTNWGTSWYAASSDLMAEMSRALKEHSTVSGNVSNANFFAMQQANYTKIADEVRRKYIGQTQWIKYDAAGKINSLFLNTQGDCTMALHFNMIPSDQRSNVLEILLNGDWGINNFNHYFGTSNHLSTGYFCSSRAMLELTRAGKTAKAYEVLMNDEFPSWLYPVRSGFTSCWEGWNTYIAGTQDPRSPDNDRGYYSYFGSMLSSFNHLPFGAVGEWIWKVCGGINPDGANPGFGKMIIRPEPGGGLSYCEASFNSIRGPVLCSWTNDAVSGVFRLSIEIPANSTASINFVGKTNTANILERGTGWTNVSGLLSPPRVCDGASLFELGAGRYEFSTD